MLKQLRQISKAFVAPLQPRPIRPASVPIWGPFGRSSRRVHRDLRSPPTISLGASTSGLAPTSSFASRAGSGSVARAVRSSASVASDFERGGARKHYAAPNSTFSISVASSSPARELFTRFDTGHFCNTSSPAGLMGAAASFTSPRSHCSKFFASRDPDKRRARNTTPARGQRPGLSGPFQEGSLEYLI